MQVSGSGQMMGGRVGGRLGFLGYWHVLAVAAWSLIALVAVLSPRVAVAGTPVVASVAEVSEAGGKTHFAVTFSKSLTYQVFALGDPYRVVVDLPDVEFRLAEGAGNKVAGLVKEFRYGLFAPGKARIVIDSDGPVTIANVRLDKLSGGKLVRLGFDLQATDEAAFKAKQAERTAGSMVAPAPVLNVPKPRLADPRRAKPVVVIDAGHGGLDSGAISPNGTKEKDIVLAIAKQLAGKLAKTKRYKVLMTRDTDVFVTLQGRVDFTRQHGANLFISIHADTADDSHWAKYRGASVYTRSEKASDDEARRLALKENMSDIMAGVEIPTTEDDTLTDILSDLVQRETRLHSQVLSEHVVHELRTATRLTEEPNRSAAFFVLKSPEVPSALIEIGFVSNKDEVGDMVSDGWRERLTTALALSVDRFFEKKVAGFPF